MTQDDFSHLDTSEGFSVLLLGWAGWSGADSRGRALGMTRPGDSENDAPVAHPHPPLP